MTHRVDDGLTECSTVAPKKIEYTFGHCRLCPPWRSQPRKLVNGLCEDHLIWAEAEEHNEPSLTTDD